jgi:hypothetical protein
VRASERRESFPWQIVPTVDPKLAEIVPLVVIVPPLNPVPAVIDVTVPPPPPLTACHDPSPRR